MAKFPTTKQSKKLEDYEPGATKSEVYGALKIVAQTPLKKQSKPSKKRPAQA